MEERNLRGAVHGDAARIAGGEMLVGQGPSTQHDGRMGAILKILHCRWLR